MVIEFFFLQIKLDLEDLNSLLENATRQKSKDLLSLEIRRLQSELIKLRESETPKDDAMKETTTKPVSIGAPKCYDIKLNNYAWDQTDDYVKLYISLNNVQNLDKDAVYCNFFENSIDLHVIGLDNKNYFLPINNLCEAIVTEKSFIKVKTNMIVVSLAKKAKKSWSHVTSVEKILKEAKSSSFKNTPNDDPNDSIMNLMKKMYQEGDDEMKRTIAKAWTENQDKKGSSMMGDLPGF